jgi:hypothetical protein
MDLKVLQRIRSSLKAKIQDSRLSAGATRLKSRRKQLMTQYRPKQLAFSEEVRPLVYVFHFSYFFHSVVL